MVHEVQEHLHLGQGEGVHPGAADGAPTRAHDQPLDAGRLPSGLLVSLALLSAFAPISMDLYLPAFPQIMADLQASASQVQWTMTTFLAGACLGQFVFGPLSDRFGRRGPLLVGSALAVVASAVAALSPSIGVLIATRLLQGVTGAAGMVIGRAVVADRARGREAARGFTLVMVINGVVPVIAPFVGSLVLTATNWRIVLATVAVVAAATLVAVVFQVPESLPPQHRTGRGGRSPAFSEAAACAHASSSPTPCASSSPSGR